MEALRQSVKGKKAAALRAPSAAKRPPSASAAGPPQRKAA